MTAPTVSICITAYNHERYIRQAIDSVLDQVVDFPIEILIGEDASTDSTRKIIEEYAGLHPDVIRPFFHRAEDKLIINGRKTGRKNFANNLLQARGDYVILLDGDDFWLDKNKLAQQVCFLQDNPDYVGCFHNAVHVDENGVLLDRLAVSLTQQDFTLEDILHANPIPTMSCLFRNPHYKELPEWFYKTDMGDWPVHILNAQHGLLHYVPAAMAAYRIHDAGIWKSFRDNATVGLYSQIRVWKILLSDANLGKDALIASLIDKNYKRVIRIARKLRNWDQVGLYLAERKAFFQRWDGYQIKHYLLMKLHQSDKPVVSEFSMLKQIKKLLRKKKKKKVDVMAAMRSEIAANPCSANLHFNYAQAAAQKNMACLAYAELKTAMFLGLNQPEAKEALVSFQAALPDLLEMNHNQWFRLHTLTKKLLEKTAGMARPQILDVGGGEGWLAAFIPDMDYCLVEPDINGISGTNLPFADKSFDYVVSCHVLEHIPVESREVYLDQLVSKARKGVILLNPFYEAGSFVEDRLQLFIDITNAPWAHEHLECSLPKVSDVEEYARKKNLLCVSEPNGTMATTLALVFVDYFAAQQDSHDKWKKINRFINSKYADIMTSEANPTAYMICLERSDSYT